jgi:hypothetical protein
LAASIISLKKAYKSSAFEIETKELAKHSQSGGEFFGVHVSNRQGCGGDWRQWRFRRSRSSRRRGRCRRILTPPDGAALHEKDSSMSHHYSGPDFSFPRGDARLDFTDLYAFHKPGDAGKSILIMNVHPSAGENPPGTTTAEPFAPEALYELKIDTDGDAVADIAYRVRFSAFERGAQTAIVRRIDGPQAAGTGDGGRLIVDGAPVSTGREARITESGDTRFFAGWRSDPFFCDVEGAKNNLQFTGDDFFADKDVCSIVLELPNSVFGAKEVRIWARTLAPGDDGWIQVERGARPAQAVILVEERGAYLAGEPADDGRFVAGFAHALEHTGGYSSAEAKRVAQTLLPDVLPYDPMRPASFPDNGRTLTDDAFDSFIRVLTNGKVTGDNVGPHRDLLFEFPYVGPPHQSRVTTGP